MLKLEFEISTNTNILEKNPTKEGTPANESRTRESILVNILAFPKLEKEKRVFIPIPEICVNVVKRRNEVRL